MSDILNPISLFTQRELLDDEIAEAEAKAEQARNASLEADRLASEAHEAAEAADALKEKRMVIIDIQNEAYELRNRLRPNIPREGSKLTQMSFSSPDSDDVVRQVVTWSATDDGEFVVALTHKQGIHIGRHEMEGFGLMDQSEEQLVALDLPVLQEILEHISQIGVQKPHVELPTVESSPVELPPVECRLYNSVDSFETVDEVEFAGSQREEH